VKNNSKAALTRQDIISRKLGSQRNKRDHSSSPPCRMAREQLSVIPKASNVISRGLRLAGFDMSFDFPNFKLGNFIFGPAMIFIDEFSSFFDLTTGCKPTRGLGNEETSNEDE
jgi:hypothetical protein